MKPIQNAPISTRVMPEFVPFVSGDRLKPKISALVANATCVTTDTVIAAMGEQPTRSLQTQVGYALRALGWRSKQETGGERRRFYVKTKT